jgi:hypothetical protein
MRQRTPIVSILVAALVAACSGATTTIGGEDTSDAGASSDGGGGVDGAASDGGGRSDGGAALDGTLPPVDANNGRVDAKIVITQLSENCQPPVANDPVLVIGTLTLANGTTATIGPGAIDLGAFLEPAGKVVATFNLDKNGLPAIPSGGTATVPLTKTAGSLSKPDGCNTLVCGKPYIVQLAISGKGIPAGTRLGTDPINVTCTL